MNNTRNIFANKISKSEWISHFFSGHRSFGPVTIFGANAMHWAVNIRTKRFGFICFRLPFYQNRRWHKLYLYFSPNATPWASTLYWGDRDEYLRAKIRKLNFGHGFSTETHSEALHALNHKFEGFKIRQFDIERFGDTGAKEMGISLEGE